MKTDQLEELFQLRGKTAFISGGASVLGREAACILAAAGANIAVSSRQLAKAEALAEEIQTAYSVKTLAIEMDQTSYVQVKAAASKLSEWTPRLDILINNAGGGSGNSIARLFERDPKHIAASIETNLTGVIYCCREMGQLLGDHDGSKIINIASIAGLIGRDRRMYDAAGMNGQPVDYAAAKAGIIGLTRDLAALLAPKAICVNSISPGGFTSAQRNHPPEFVNAYSARTPLGRMGKDGIDLRGAFLFLASSASDYITGHNLVVDGGFSIWQ
jgi:NAD(P)-dependent dehydrogenase (short-subunit alcohol dehydrogenase family)